MRDRGTPNFAGSFCLMQNGSGKNISKQPFYDGDTGKGRLLFFAVQSSEGEPAPRGAAEVPARAAGAGWGRKSPHGVPTVFADKTPSGTAECGAGGQK